jgi:hypothetical protein
VDPCRRSQPVAKLPWLSLPGYIHRLDRRKPELAPQVSSCLGWSSACVKQAAHHVVLRGTPACTYLKRDACLIPLRYMHQQHIQHIYPSIFVYNPFYQPYGLFFK